MGISKEMRIILVMLLQSEVLALESMDSYLQFITAIAFHSVIVGYIVYPLIHGKNESICLLIRAMWVVYELCTTLPFRIFLLPIKQLLNETWTQKSSYVHTLFFFPFFTTMHLFSNTSENQVGKKMNVMPAHSAPREKKKHQNFTYIFWY